VQTLVVNLPSREMPKDAKKSFHQQVRLTFKDKNTQVRAQKSDLTSVSDCVMSNEGKTSSIYSVS
jgi:hypothetical protein